MSLNLDKGYRGPVKLPDLQVFVFRQRIYIRHVKVARFPGLCSTDQPCDIKINEIVCLADNVKIKLIMNFYVWDTFAGRIKSVHVQEYAKNVCKQQVLSVEKLTQW